MKWSSEPDDLEPDDLDVVIFSRSSR